MRKFKFNEKTTVSIRDFSKGQAAAEYIVLFLASLIFMLLFSLWTSPYYSDWYGCDASFFTLVGRGITQGKVMYRDFYDLKGPYFFFLQALGQLFFKGRIGIFLLQVIAQFMSSVLIWKISLLFVDKAKAAFIMVVFYICHIATLWGGNTLEEFVLPLSLFCLYIILCDYLENDFTIPSSHAFILGACLGIIVFSKISVCGTVLGIIAAVSFMLITKKRLSQFMLFIVYTILGFAVAALLPILYFAYYGCLTDMLRCVFVIGFRRSKDFAELFNITWELKCSGAVFAFVFAITHRRRIDSKIGVTLLAMSAATYLLLHLGTPFYYYFTSVYPCLILALALFLKIYNPLFVFEGPRQAACLLLMAVFLIYYVPTSVETVRTAMFDHGSTSYSDYVNGSKELASLIPQFQKDSVFSFLIDMQWYEINGLMPDNKYVVNLPFFIALDENALAQLTDYLTDTPPTWLVVGDYFADNLPEIADIVESKYSCIYDNSVGHLYLLDQ